MVQRKAQSSYVFALAVFRPPVCDLLADILRFNRFLLVLCVNNTLRKRNETKAGCCRLNGCGNRTQPYKTTDTMISNNIHSIWTQLTLWNKRAQDIQGSFSKLGAPRQTPSTSILNWTKYTIHWVALFKWNGWCQILVWKKQIKFKIAVTNIIPSFRVSQITNLSITVKISIASKFNNGAKADKVAKISNLASSRSKP